MHYFPAEFSLDPDLCYLNHAAVAPWPRRTAQAVERFAYQNMTRGARDYPRWMETEQRLRERLAWLIGAPSPEDIALVKNTSEGLSFVAAGLDWKAGDQVVGIADDFPSNRVVWEALGGQGVVFKTVDINTAEDPEQALLDRFSDRTRLLAVSSVHFATGLRLDLPRLAAACRERGVLLCVDAIQSLGALPFDLRQIPADFVVADGHKWMLGPEGLGLFYVNPSIRDRMKLIEFGWAMRAQAGDYDPGPWQPASSARRFECGSPNMLGIHALEASLSLLQEIGMDEIERHLRGNVGYLRGELSAIPGLSFVTPEPAARHAGILSFRIEGVDLDKVYRRLMASGVVCALRGGNLRFSPHFHTRTETLDLAVERLRQALNECRNS
ncbi:MAG: aminotransferase class V-fold PLP-dependent enzyme [Gammaproteobacteria bacterium]|nr:MAG: aminotransferase class V-fold PLP-dependent enzyme [Gammaproteobacteria bacterium]